MPPKPLHVILYVVIPVGETVVLPDVPTEPIPWLIEQEFAYVEFQLSDADPPRMMLEGEAEIFTVGGGGIVTSIVPVRASADRELLSMTTFAVYVPGDGYEHVVD